MFDSCDSIVGWTVLSSKAVETQGDNTLTVDTANKVEGTGSLLATLAATGGNWGGMFYKRPSSGVWNFSQKPIMRISFKLNQELSSEQDILLDLVCGTVNNSWAGGFKVGLKNSSILGQFVQIDVDLRTLTSEGEFFNPSQVKQVSFTSAGGYFPTAISFNLDAIDNVAGGSLPLLGTLYPKSSTIVVGSPQTFKASQIGGSAPYTYVWRVNQVVQHGTVGDTYVFSSLDVGTYVIVCDIQDSMGTIVTTNSATIMVNSLKNIPNPHNAMLIYDQPWVAAKQNCLNNYQEVVDRCKNGNTEFAIIFVGYINSLNPTSPRIEYYRTADFYKTVINAFHVAGIKVIAWAEDGYSNLGLCNISPANWQNLYTMILGAVNIGFDGYLDDIENWTGPHGQNTPDNASSYLDHIAWLNSLTPVLHNIGKLNMPVAGFDWQQHENNQLYVDYICSMFYSSVSTLEDPQGDYYWQENFGEWDGHNTPPASPMIVLLMNGYMNANPLSWQLAQVSRLLDTYPSPNLAGLGVWIYEYMWNTASDWDAWNYWHTGIIEPSDTGTLEVRTTPSEAPIIAGGIEETTPFGPTEFTVGQVPIVYGYIQGYFTPQPVTAQIVGGMNTLIEQTYTSIPPPPTTYDLMVTVVRNLQPTSGATVKLISGPTTAPDQVTDLNGRTVFLGLLEGNYRFDAHYIPEVGLPEYGTVTVDPSATSTVDISVSTPTPKPSTLPLILGAGLVIGSIIYTGTGKKEPKKKKR